MRRVFLSLLGLSWLGLIGCHHTCSHGVCDCQYDDHCCTRSPWVNDAAPSLGAPLGGVPGGTVVPYKEMPKTTPDKL